MMGDPFGRPRAGSWGGMAWQIVAAAAGVGLYLRRLIFTTTIWAATGMETYLYRPLAVLTYALNHAVSGLEPWSYHLVNVVLHARVAVMVFRLGRLWRLPLAVAGLGALLFAVHPVHVEVVANMVGRKDLLATAFVLGMALTHRPALGGGLVGVSVPVVLFAGGLLSKEVGVAGLSCLWRRKTCTWKVTEGNSSPVGEFGFSMRPTWRLSSSSSRCGAGSREAWVCPRPSRSTTRWCPWGR